MARRFLITAFTRLFRIYPDGPVYCSYSALESIKISGDHDTFWKCGYCKIRVPSQVYLCPGCQNPRSKADMVCVASFTGIIPHAVHLFGLGKDDIVEVLFGLCSDPRKYYEGSCMMRLYDFEIKEIAIPNIMAIGPDDVQRLDCWVKTSCRVEMYFGRLFKEEKQD